jgi:DNA-binding response OmpR family regulator
MSVLIIEDCSALCDMYANYLEFEGFRTAKAYSGDEAVKAFAKACPDVVIADHGLPDREAGMLDELEALFFAAGKKPRIVVITGDTVAARTITRPSVVMVLVKPQSFQTVIDVIKKYA